ncbi:MAG: ATP-grasp domain-containing protein [Planctomycetia bacterium]|nr:ATP-grasp domain-containing protein [Planctomycetia bacterium]
MRIFVYEFVTGGGWYCHSSQPPPRSLLSEGFAILRSLVADFCSLGGVSVDVLQDVRYRDLQLPDCTLHAVHSAVEEEQAIERLSSVADWSVIVAPEFFGYLHARCQAVERGGGQLLGPDSRLVALASDKHATAGHLRAHGVRVPEGIVLAPGEPLPRSFEYPAVLKPRDGAGSQGIEWIDRPTRHRTNGDVPGRLETFCEGTPASVAALCGPGQMVPLAPCRQLLTSDGRLVYLGGALPMDAHLAGRATRLAAQVIRTLENPLGYVGVDLVLGDDLSGAGDTVIEINPRLTTSYVGLRALADGNLAAAMIAVAAGHPVELCWQSGPIQFEASGAVRFCSPLGGV